MPSAWAIDVVGDIAVVQYVLPQFKALNDGIERLANNEPSFESVIAKRPQLVAAELEWVVGPQGVVGTREQFHELKIPTYLLPSDCEAKNNRVGADGTRLEPFRIDTIYKGIRQLAEIFDVQDRGQQLNDELKARLAKSVATVQGKGLKQASALVWFSSAEMASDPMWPVTRVSPNSCCKRSDCATWCSPMRNGPPSAGKPSPRPTPPCW